MPVIAAPFVQYSKENSGEQALLEIQEPDAVLIRSPAVHGSNSLNSLAAPDSLAEWLSDNLEVQALALMIGKGF